MTRCRHRICIPYVLVGRRSIAGTWRRVCVESRIELPVIIVKGERIRDGNPASRNPRNPHDAGTDGGRDKVEIHRRRRAGARTGKRMNQERLSVTRSRGIELHQVIAHAVPKSELFQFSIAAALFIRMHRTDGERHDTDSRRTGNRTGCGRHDWLVVGDDGQEQGAYFAIRRIEPGRIDLGIQETVGDAPRGRVTARHPWPIWRRCEFDGVARPRDGFRRIAITGAAVRDGHREQ